MSGFVAPDIRKHFFKKHDNMRKADWKKCIAMKSNLILIAST